MLFCFLENNSLFFLLLFQIHAHQYATGTPEERCELIELWDIGGSSVHRESCSVFMDNVAGVIFVHDLSNSKSEQNLALWADLIYNYRLQNSQMNFNSSRLANDSQINCNLLAPDIEKFGSFPTLIVGRRFVCLFACLKCIFKAVVWIWPLNEHAIIPFSCRRSNPRKVCCSTREKKSRPARRPAFFFRGFSTRSSKRIAQSRIVYRFRSRVDVVFYK